MAPSYFSLSLLFSLFAMTDAFCNSSLATKRFLGAYNEFTPHPFDFALFFNLSIFPDAASPRLDTESESCVNHPFSWNGTTAINMEGCRNITGWGWHHYEAATILDRLHTWKSPVIVLVFLVPRMPLGWLTWIFTLVQVTGNPIDAVAGLLYTLEVCKTRVDKLRKRGFSKGVCKSIVLLISSYDACGLPATADKLERLCLCTDASKYEREDIVVMASEVLPDFVDALPEYLEDKVQALAADRSNAVAVVLVSELIFLFTFVTDYLVVVQTPSGPTNWQTIEIHSIAFSLTLLWIMAAIPLASGIGFYQSEASISRILKTWSYQTGRSDAVANGDFWIAVAERISSSLQEPTLAFRRANGGMSSWRPDKFNRASNREDSHLSRYQSSARMRYICAIATLAVASGTIAAMILSYQVPPGNWCRPRWQANMFWVWLGSFVLECGLTFFIVSGRETFRFALSFAKDAIALAINIYIILFTQWGNMKVCSCWEKEDMLVLPQYAWVIDEMRRKNQILFPHIIFGVIFVMLSLVLCLWYYYRHALAVYGQDDKGKSTWKIKKRFRDSIHRLTRFPEKAGKGCATGLCVQLPSGNSADVDGTSEEIRLLLPSVQSETCQRVTGDRIAGAVVNSSSLTLEDERLLRRACDLLERLERNHAPPPTEAPRETDRRHSQDEVV